jgi:GNAT superfamily N-acetyltransferase
MQALLDTGDPVGLLAYAGAPDTDEEQVAGWCSVAPRSAYPRFARTAVGRARRDPTGRWAVPCFFVRAEHRRRGFTDDLLAAACEHSRANGATAVEGYPLTTKAGPSDLFVGTKSLFARHGFVVVGEPTQRRAVMERTFANT